MKVLKTLALAALCSGLYLPKAKCQTQVITTPRNSPQASVSQTVGITNVSLFYSRPAVNNREIWGQLVPFGMTNPGWGTATSAPWRVGADENTVIEFDTEIKIENTTVPAGRYALFMEMKDKENVQLILSSNSTSWGAYFYDAAETVATIPVKSQAHSHTEFLTFAFDQLTINSAVCTMTWSDLAISFRVSVDEKSTTLAKIKEEMRGTALFSYIGPMEAASWCLQNDINLEEALGWANTAANMNANYNTLSVKAGIQEKLGKSEEATKTMDEALKYAKVYELHGYGRSLLAQGKTDRAIEVFELNAKKHPNQWPVNYGLARGYSAKGDYKKALVFLEKAEKNCPDEINRNMIKQNIEKLKKGQDIN